MPRGLVIRKRKVIVKGKRREDRMPATPIIIIITIYFKIIVYDFLKLFKNMTQTQEVGNTIQKCT